MQTRRSPGQRAGLTTARVVAAARALLAEGGTEALTMRALARRLDVSPNALYSHVPSKTALVDDLLDQVLGEVQTPDPGVADPRTGIYALMASSYDVLLGHPDLVALYLARQGARGPNARRLGEITLPMLGRAGIHGARAIEALRVLIVFTIGFAAFATRAPVAPGDDEPLVPEEEIRGNFRSGLDWLLTGIGVPAAGAPGSPG